MSLPPCALQYDESQKWSERTLWSYRRWCCGHPGEMWSGWSRTATDCPSTWKAWLGPPRMSWVIPAKEVYAAWHPSCPRHIPGHPRLWRQCKVPGSQVQHVLGCPCHGGSVRSQGPRSNMSLDIPGHPGISNADCILALVNHSNCCNFCCILL